MKTLFQISVLFVSLCSICSGAFAQSDYQREIKEYRDSINAEFADTATSILLKEDIPAFKGLHYFPASEQWLVRAKFRKKIFRPSFEMQTSTERLPVYRKYGVLKFMVGDERVKLTVYQNVALTEKEGYEDYLFCPFRDLTAPEESYGGGRYLDFKMDDLSKDCLIDFNKSYNPYCAYNYKYSCPIPPKENHLNVRIEAGIKKWH